MASRRDELAKLVVVTACGVACGFYILWKRMPPRDTWSSPEEKTSSHILGVLSWSMNYRAQCHSWPEKDNWVSALHAFIKDPAERRQFDDEVSDAWGMPLHCQTFAEGKEVGFECVSFGPNHNDDHNGGDDVVGTIINNSLSIMCNGKSAWDTRAPVVKATSEPGSVHTGF